MAIGEKNADTNDAALATALNNLAQLYRLLARYTLAEPLYLRALTILEKAFGPKHPEVALPLTNLATQYYDQSRLSAAEPLLSKALRIQEESLGPVHPDVAATLNNLAAVAAADGQLRRPNSSTAGVLRSRKRSSGRSIPESLPGSTIWPSFCYRDHPMSILSPFCIGRFRFGRRLSAQHIPMWHCHSTVLPTSIAHKSSGTQQSASCIAP